MKTHITYCRICEAACGMLADVKDDRVVALRPDRDHVVSRGFVCAKGTRFSEIHHSPNRVDRPLMRTGNDPGQSLTTDDPGKSPTRDRLQPVTWKRALNDAGRRLAAIRRQHGPHAVGVYIGNPAAFSYTLPVYGAAFVQALGTRNYFTAGSLDCNNKFLVARQMLGSAGTHPVPDLDAARFALLLGTNPSVSQSSFVNAPRMVERLQQIERRGGRVVIVDPRRSETAKLVGTHLPIRPDTDAALLLALLHVVFDEGLERQDTIERYSDGVEALRAAVRRFTPARVAGATGIPAETIRELARSFAAADGAFCHLSTGVNQGRFGTIAYAAKIALELCTGQLDRHGGARLMRGAADTARLARRVGLDREPRWRSRIGGFSPVLGALPTGILADEILEPGDERIRALVVVAGNPLMSAPDGDRMREALRSLDTLISVDLFVNDTGAHASHVLPCTDFLEREDFPLAQLQLQPTPYLQWTEAVVPPRAERRHDWQILRDLAGAAKVPLFGNRVADAAVRAALTVGGPRALALPLLAPALGLRPGKRLKQAPHGIDLTHRERPGHFLRRGFPTASGKIELYPPDVWERLHELEASLDAPADELRLVSKRERLGHNSWMHDNPRLPTAEHAAHVAPGDAARLGVKSGDRVRLSCNDRSIELPVVVDPDLCEGAVAVPHGYGHEPGSSWQHAIARGGQNVNRLARAGADAVDPVSGMSQLIGIPVRITQLTTHASAEEAARASAE